MCICFFSIKGHEIAGEVYSLDSKSRPDDPDLKVRDRVLVYPWVGCGQCERCTNGISQLCDQSVIYNIGVGAPGGLVTSTFISHSYIIHR